MPPLGSALNLPQGGVSRREDSYYAARYKEIGQVTVAIMLQFCIESALHATSPAELAIKKMEQAVQAIRTGFRGFFDGDLEVMAEGLKTEGYLREARDLAAEADPSVQLAPGWQAPFKLRLYTMSLGDGASCFLMLCFLMLCFALLGLALLRSLV